MSENTLLAADHYLAEADALKYGDPASLLHAAQSAAAHARNMGDFHRYARAMVHQAWAYGFINQYELSLSHALEALMLAREAHMVDVEALAVGVIAFNFLKCGILQEAAYLFEHQRALGEQLHDNALQAMALNDLAVVKMESEDYQTAAQLLRQSVALMPPDTHEGMDKSLTHLNLAFACVKTQQFDEAVYHANEVLTREKTSPKIISDAHLWIASSHLGRGELEEARSRLALARHCVESVSPPIYNDNVEGVTAELCELEGKYAEAARIREHMYEMAVQRQELDYAISALHHLKQDYERLNDPSALVSVYKRLAEDIPARQKQSSDLRFTVLRLVFSKDRAALEAELHLSQQKSAILNRLSHEFRTPLAVIQSSSALLERYTERLSLEQRQQYLQRITAQVQWMTVMLDDILEVLRMDENQSALLTPARFQLDDLAQAAMYQIERYRVPTTQIDMDIQSACIQSAPQALQTILAHLLTNAIKFSQQAVRLHLSVVEDVLVMQVTDEGIGIPLAEQQEVFKPLVRGSNLDEVTGNGIGLTIVARLVQQLRGKIDLESEPGKGTRVTVRIPLS
jgi:signal transduction histidine kinase